MSESQMMRSAKQEKAAGRAGTKRPTRSSAPAVPPPLAREKSAAPFLLGGAAPQVMPAQAVQAQRVAFCAGSPSHQPPPLRREAGLWQAPTLRQRRLQRRCCQKATAARQKEAFPSP